MSQNPSLAKPSDLAPKGAVATAPAGARAGDPARPLPPPMKMRIQAGSTVALEKDQTFSDGRTLQRDRVGRVLYPSSQAACWVVYFEDEDRKQRSRFRVLPESILRVVSAPAHSH